MKTITNITIKDVARAAQLSAATISRALNGHSAVTPQTRARALNAAENLGYLPDGIAESLRCKQTFMISLLLRDISNPNVALINRGAAEAAANRAYALFMCNSGWSLEAERQILRSIAKRRFAGVLVLPVDEESSDIDLLLRLGIPVVLIESEFSGSRPHLDSVVSDNFGGATKAARCLVNWGHRRIGVVVGSEQILPGRDRLAGFRQACAEQGIPLGDSYVRVGSFSEEHGYRSTLDLMRKADRPTALFSGSNQIFRGVLTALRETAVRIPEDVSLVTFDDSALAQLHQPPITVVARDLTEIGRQAVNMVVDRIEGHETEGNKKLVVPMRLIVRSSCSAASR